MRGVSRSLGDRTSRQCVGEVLQTTWRWAEASGLSCPSPEMMSDPSFFVVKLSSRSVTSCVKRGKVCECQETVTNCVFEYMSRD